MMGWLGETKGDVREDKSERTLVIAKGWKVSPCV